MDCQQIQLKCENLSHDDEPMLSQIFFEPQVFNSRSLGPKEEFSWIDEYLFPDVLKENIFEEEPEPVSPQIEELPIIESFFDKKSEVPEGIVEHKKNRSIFHNVQKHLITFLKKIHIRRVDLINKPSGLRAYELWRIFKFSKDYTKKGLYMIFGVTQDHNEDNVRRLSRSYPDLDKIFSKVPFQAIEESQALIREQVLLQVSRMTKNVIRSQCKMAKFDEFYDYLQTFLDELSGPGLSIRMKKEQKKRVVEKSSSQEQERSLEVE